MADTEAESGPENTPSSLDEMTHGELLRIYDDSVRSILFAKQLQWRTVGATLTLYLVMIGLVKFVSSAAALVALVKIGVILAATGAILIIIIYQFWQSTEGRKIIGVTKNMSTAFRSIRAVKSNLEANVHRYLLLAIMLILVLFGGFLSLEAIGLVPPPAAANIMIK